MVRRSYLCAWGMDKINVGLNRKKIGGRRPDTPFVWCGEQEQTEKSARLLAILAHGRMKQKD